MLFRYIALLTMLLGLQPAHAQNCPDYTQSAAESFLRRNPQFKDVIANGGLQPSVHNPLSKEVELRFFRPQDGALMQTFSVPPGADGTLGLQVDGKPFVAGPDWGVSVSAGGITSCIHFLGSVTNSVNGSGPVLEISYFLRNGRLESATPKPRAPVAKVVTDTVTVIEDPEPAPAAQPREQKDRRYEISVYNGTPWPLDVICVVDAEGNGQEHTKIVRAVPPGTKQLIITARVGAFCLRAEATDGTGKRRAWGGDAIRSVEGEALKFKCRVLGDKQWTYTASFTAQN